MINYINLKMLPELHALVADAADADGVPMNEWVVRLLAKHFDSPGLASVPRKRMGRPRNAVAGEPVPA